VRVTAAQFKSSTREPVRVEQARSVRWAPKGPPEDAESRYPTLAVGCRRSHSAREMAEEFGVSVQVIAGILGATQRKLAQGGLMPSATCAQPAVTPAAGGDAESTSHETPERAGSVLTPARKL
jgi:hypothetical protein